MKKKILSILLMFAFLLPCAFALVGCGHKHSYTGHFDLKCDGCGESRNEIVVSTKDQLKELAEAVNGGTSFENVTIKLDADIDLGNEEWTPIGYGNSEANGTKNAGYRFNGTFDGQGHTISNLKVTTFVGGSSTANGATGVGLFGAAFNATIKNFTIKNATIKGNHFVAAVVGHARGTTIEDVDVENADIDCVVLNNDENGDKAGVVVGFIGISPEKGSLVKDCSAKDSTVKAGRDAGQIIGCFAILDIKGTGTTNRAVQEGNTATNVTVSRNEGSTGANIKNEIVGRIEDQTAFN